MLTKIILTGIAIGAACGCVGAILYVWSLALINILRDLKHFADYELLLFGLLCFLVIIPSTLLGAVTGAVLALLFQIFHHQKNLYMIACVSLCISAFIGSLTSLFGLNWMDKMTVSDPYSSEGIFFFATCVAPGILYSLLGLFVSRYMFDRFKLVELEYQALSENDAIAT